MSMNLFGATEAFAMAGNAGGQPGGRPGYEGIIMLVIMFAIFYFLLIRPQQKKVKEHQAYITGLKKGDKVVTNGGIYGEITGLTDTVVTLEIADNVRIKIARAHIAGGQGMVVAPDADSAPGGG
jgi:preprotein translocase subunit YajC